MPLRLFPSDRDSSSALISGLTKMYISMSNRYQSQSYSYNEDNAFISSPSFASSHLLSGVRGVTSEQSSYHKLRLVLGGDLDLLSNLFLGVLLDMDLTGDACMNLVVCFFSLVEIWMEIFARSLLDYSSF